jgi:HSP20 family protein
MVNTKGKKQKDLTVRQPKARSQNLPVAFNDAFGQSFLPSGWGGFFSDEAMWSPAINILEKEDKFVAKVELPGVHEEDVSVSLVGDMLIIEGEKESESEVKEKGYSYNETSYGSFSRSIALPSIVDADKIAANFDKGVLEIDLPKSVKIKQKKVSVTKKKKVKTVAKEEPTKGTDKKENTKK